MILASSYVSARRNSKQERVATTADVSSPGASKDFVEAGQNPKKYVEVRKPARR